MKWGIEFSLAILAVIFVNVPRVFASPTKHLKVVTITFDETEAKRAEKKPTAEEIAQDPELSAQARVVERQQASMDEAIPDPSSSDGWNLR